MTSIARTVAKVTAKFLAAFSLGLWTGTELIIRQSLKTGTRVVKPEWFDFAAWLNWLAIVVFLFGVAVWVGLDYADMGKH